MTIPKLVRTLARVSALSGALLLSSATAQDLLPSVSFSGTGDWSSGSNWTLDGSDPPESGAPGDSDVAVVSGGVASVSSSTNSVHSLSLTRGTVSLESGGTLNVDNQAIVGEGGVLGLAGGSISAGSVAVLGTLDLPADADLSFGSAFPFATSSSVLGTPKQITVGGRRANLETGLGLGMVATDAGASVVVESVPVLEVSRSTGEAAIKNMVGGPIDLAGYTVSSASQLIRRTGGAWTSLEDQGLAGWEEANPDRNSRFSELNILGSTTLNVGDTWEIGPIWQGIGEPPAKEDLKFEYLLADGRVMTTPVVFTGPPNDLFLAIDPATGEGSINHISPLIGDFDVTAISITSASGSLNAPTEAVLGEDWAVGNPQDTAYLEASLSGSRVFSLNNIVSLGNIWKTGGDQDLKFQFATTDGALRTGSVIYGAADAGPLCNPGTGGDLDGNGSVEFADFLVLSANFGQDVADHTQGDIDCNGRVEFADFLVLSSAFGTTVGAEASSVPEPASGLLFFLGFLGMLKFRKRASRVAVVAAAVTLCAAAQPTMAQEFDARFIRVHPAGPNNGIADLTEALGILNGSVVDAILNEDIDSTLAVVDVGGDLGTFTFDQSPYPNGIDDSSQDNIAMIVSGTVEIPAGDWSIGCGSDDGCFVTFSNPEITFSETFNENGATVVDGDGTIFFNAGRGHDWTFGNFSVGSDTVTGIQMGFYEGGVGDSFEVAIFNEHVLAAEVDTLENRAATAGLFAELPGFGDVEWTITGDPFVSIPGDFNADGVVDTADAEILVENFGDAGGFASGDINFDGEINFHDASLFRPILAAATAGGEASVVPEPGSVSLLLVGFLTLLGFRRKRA